MPQYYRWLIENQVIYYRVVGDFTSDQMSSLDLQIVSMFEASSQQQIHVVNDISTMGKLPNVRVMMNLRFLNHPRMGYCVVQQRNRLEVFIGNTVGKILKVKYQFVDVLEDGIHFLAKIDESLPSIDDMLERLKVVQQETLDEGQDFLTT